MEEDVVGAVVQDIADGRPVDWERLLQEATTPSARARLNDLQLLGRIAAMNQTWMSGDPGLTPPAPAGTPAPPRVDFGRYALLEKVGEGAFGAVYRAWDPELEFEVALKILHARAGGPTRERLIREGRALAKVRHPNVVKVFGIETEGDEVALCMEFVRGDTLESVVGKVGTLNAREAALIGEDVCSALAAVHQASIVHRDVKARNVVRETAGRIVLMDFGAGHRLDAGPTHAEGTPLYMAPEVLAGVPATECSDVYSAGVLLYYLVTGGYPVEGQSVEELCAAHMQGRRHRLSDRRPDLPLAFRQAVEGALAPDPRERCSTAGAMREALERVRTVPLQSSFGRYVLRPVLAGAAIAAVLMAFGILTSRYFNYALGLGEFAQEGPWDWLVYGARAMFGPVVVGAGGVVLITAAVAAWRLLVTVSTPLASAGAWLAARRDAVAARLHLHDPAVLAAHLLLASSVALVATWWIFRPLVSAFFSDVPAAATSSLALLSTDYCTTHEQFQLALIAVTWCSVAGWVHVIRIARRLNQRLPRGVLAGGLVVAAFALISLTGPWRVLNANRHEAVMWDDTTCYLMAARGEEALLFCPTLEGWRNRVVPRGDVAALGTEESIFWRFARSPQPMRTCP